MDTGAHHGASLDQHAQRGGHELAGRSEDDRGVEFLGRSAARLARPRGAEFAREILRPFIARARESEHAATLVAGDLADDVRRGAEAIEPEPLRIGGHPQRAIADQPGAQQRCRLQVGIPIGDREAIAAVGDDELGEAPVTVGAGEASLVAEVLSAGAAIAARAAGPSEPRDADPLAAALHRSDDLVAWHDWQLAGSDLPIEDVEVRTADAAGVHPDQQLARVRSRNRQVGQAKRLSRRVEQHRAHQSEANQPESRSPALRGCATEPQAGAEASGAVTIGGVGAVWVGLVGRWDPVE